MNVLSVQGLGKRFRRQGAQPRTLKQLILRSDASGRKAEYFWGLRDISFDVSAGKTVGLIGQNGAGKSTLLRLLGGVGRPDVGRVQTQGRIGALLDLGSGFHPDLSGRENVMINGVIAGLTRREVAARFDQIVAFAELERFIDSPLRTYSSGMQMRLAFAIAAYTDPQILLVDEVLAVGDLAFQQKCLNRIAEFKANGCTIVVVSHDLSQISELCDEVIWLRGGQMIAQGPAKTVVAQYVDSMTTETKRRTASSGPIRRLASGVELQPNTNRFGSLEAEITDVRLLGRNGHAVTMLESGSMLRVGVDIRAEQRIQSPIISVSISRADGTICVDTNTSQAGIVLPDCESRETLALDFERLDLADGQYFVDVGLYEREWHYAYDYHWHVYPLSMHAPVSSQGVIHPPQRWEIATLEDYVEHSR